MSKLDQITNLFTKISGLILFFITTAILAFLTFKSLVVTYYASPEYIGYNWSYSIPDSIVRNILFAGVVLALIFLFSYFEKKHPGKAELMERILSFSLILLYFALGMVYVLTSPYYPTGDQISTTAGAAYALEGNYLMFQPLGYIGIWPHQKGLLFFYEIAFKLFGSFNYTPVRIITVVMNTLTIFLARVLLKDLNASVTSRLTCTLLFFSFIPYFFLLPYAYGDLPAIFGTMVMACFFLKFLRKKNLFFLILASLGGTFAILNRSAAWIAVIALIITALLISISEKKIHPIAGAVCVALVCFLCLEGINIGYEKVSGYDRFTGSPAISHVAMGLQETDGAPGVFNRYHQTLYEKYEGDRTLAAAEAKEYVSGRLAEFQADKLMCLKFFHNKILYQWTEPMFEANVHMHSFQPDTVLSDFYESLYSGELHNISCELMNRFQSLIYLLCLFVSARSFICLFRRKADPDLYRWFFLIYMTGGFLFSLMWETKARYILPYFIFMIIAASLAFSKEKE
jgi:hypothetical protein